MTWLTFIKELRLRYDWFPVQRRVPRAPPAKDYHLQLDDNTTVILWGTARKAYFKIVRLESEHEYSPPLTTPEETETRALYVHARRCADDRELHSIMTREQHE